MGPDFLQIGEILWQEGVTKRELICGGITGGLHCVLVAFQTVGFWFAFSPKGSW